MPSRMSFKELCFKDPSFFILPACSSFQPGTEKPVHRLFLSPQPMLFFNCVPLLLQNSSCLLWLPATPEHNDAAVGMATFEKQ